MNTKIETSSRLLQPGKYQLTYGNPNVRGQKSAIVEATHAAQAVVIVLGGCDKLIGNNYSVGALFGTVARTDLPEDSATHSQPPAAGEAAHTPTPWAYVPEAALFGKDRNWGFIKSEAVRACVVGVGEFTKTVFGEQEHYCGVRILPQDAAFIVRACNSHSEMVKALEAIQIMAADYAVDSDKQRALKAGQIAMLARAALQSAKGA